MKSATGEAGVGGLMIQTCLGIIARLHFRINIKRNWGGVEYSSLEPFLFMYEAPDSILALKKMEKEKKMKSKVKPWLWSIPSPTAQVSQTGQWSVPRQGGGQSWAPAQGAQRQGSDQSWAPTQSVKSLFPRPLEGRHKAPTGWRMHCDVFQGDQSWLYTDPRRDLPGL